MLNLQDKNCKDCFDCASKSPMFELLSKEELQLINDNKFEVKFRKGEMIRKQGTFLSHVITINSGLAKLYIEGLHGKNLILRIIKTKSFIGGPGMYYDQRHHYSVIALVDLSACFIDMKIFKQVIHTNQEFANEFMKEFSKTMLLTYDRLISLTHKNTVGRMAEALLYLANDIFEINKLDPVISKTDLADLTGMAKDSAVKILREFKEEKLISLDQGIEILNPQALVKISEFG
ncbi:MAG: Crp/Fnr family transcriptional regulator [Bacteroidales bacterium]|nr:Crp/Fnr family transcriptional regulator [Bacteroidales bacterium]MCF8404730.1 Crp/Fnr family transcriptional regulator [Bacteroidales bacterium]